MKVMSNKALTLTQKALKRRRYFRFRLSDKIKTNDGQVGTIQKNIADGHTYQTIGL